MAGVVQNEVMPSSNKITYKDLLTIRGMDQAVISFNNSLKDHHLYDLMTDQRFLDGLTSVQSASLDFSSHSFLTDDVIISLVEKVPSIQAINLKSCTSLTDRSISYIAKHCKHLESIDLSWCNISAKSVFAFAENKTPLKRINVRSCYITDACIESLLQKCTSINELLLPWCKSLTRQTLENIVQFNPDIIAFDIRGNEKIEEDAWIKFFNQVKNIKVLHLKRCKGITADVINSTKHLPLKKLNLRGGLEGSNPSDDVWSSFFDHQRDLESIDLAWHHYLTDEAIIQLSKSCPNLRAIDLSGCCKLSTKALLSLTQNCQQLEKIILFNNPQISIPADIQHKIMQF